MSHVVEMDVKVLDKELLIKAAVKCGLEVVERSSYKWFGTHVGDYPIPEGFTKEDLGKCDFALSIPGNDKAYEIGVVKRNGEYKLLWDFWQGGYGLQKQIGDNGDNLAQAYSNEVTKDELYSQGYQVSEETLEDGTIQLTAER